MAAVETPKLLDKQIDRLYALPPEEFTRARDELAAGMRASGDGEGATRVRRLEKPTVVAWTVNQLARRKSQELRRLLSAVDRLRKAQEAALGDGPPEAVREAAEAERQALGVLAEAAGEILEQENRRRAGVVDRVVATLRAGAVDPESRRLLKTGRLTRELEPAGFSGLTGLAAPAGRRGEDRAVREREVRERVQRLEAEVGRLTDALATADDRVREAERGAERAHQAAEGARDELRRAEADLESARADLD